MAGRFIYVQCMQCFGEAVKTGKIPSLTTYKIFNHNRIDEHISFVCEHGHKNIVMVGELQFETLLHIAFDDFYNQYYRESVFNFAAAQERFFEFAIGLICAEAGIGYTEIMDAWTLIANQSERQLGAFYFLFFQRFKTKPFLKKFEDYAGIRNAVVHKGKSPSKQEARNYGEFVIENIHHILTHLQENIEPKFVYDFKSANMQDSWRKRGNPPAGAFIISIFDSILSWRLASTEDLEQERRLQKYSAEHPEEYAQAADKANQTQNVLFVNDDGKLTLVAPKDFMKKDPNAKLQVKTFDEYVVATQQMKSHYLACERSTNPDLKIVDRAHE